MKVSCVQHFETIAEGSASVHLAEHESRIATKESETTPVSVLRHPATVEGKRAV
jgi:hypothetical protein